MNETAPRASQPGDQSAKNDADPSAPSRRRRIVVRVLVAATLLTLTGMAVRTTRWWGCNFTPGDQAAAVAAYRKDPAFLLAPPNGRLFEEMSKTRACDYRPGSWEREESAGPEFATVWRQYTVERGYTSDELIALVGPSVTAAGWHFVIHRGNPGGAFLRYCKTINGMTARLEVSSMADGTPEHDATFIVLIDGRPDSPDCSRAR
ncbi:hypothetical protein V6U90_06140 [Micromonospora sp. CPCC 206060]|uniref:hypothetical protein n=1 Tax=Micromonospora sp. CPCC 206060 TaxID=3122406 RepID=UPI002FF2B9A9